MSDSYDGLDLSDNDLIFFRLLDQAEALANAFLANIRLHCYLTFKDDNVIISFLGNFPSCPLPGITYSNQKDSLQQSACSIGDAFSAAYTKLVEQSNSLTAFKLDKNRLDDVYKIISDMHLLLVAVESLDNAVATPSDLIDRLSYFCQSNMKPFYGDRGIKDNIYQVLDKSINCQTPDHTAFLSYLQNEINFDYECDNLYQVCGAILDYLCRHIIREKYNSRVHKYSLRRCPRCGRYFTTSDRKMIYCQHIDESGRSCSYQQESDRKKKLAQTPKNDAEQLAEKIRCRLYSYRTAIKISRNDYTDDPRYSERDKLYKLYTKCCKEHSQRPDFAEWVEECAAQLPKSRNESYDKFKKWLLERS